ncbi:ATP-dependent DNA helicase RecG [Paenalcaligenes niemegkensis]|uniref:ATP-dependent DNA helicase RecG n=1 Tax=Paenalcaligenes niemegkensis TaxID=2895469 RepID=UPI001EE82108|nr:ATP-dependent DNA helicase RecG [Paenalcaligenes niemegkensis]MCQ9616341.1 ATP-dependent DNA helicase RecG [Paenalcaligenes niemegkensis]
MASTSASFTPAKTAKKRAPTQADRFKRLGLMSDDDFIVHLPLRYEDETQVNTISQARPGEFIQIEGEIVQQEQSARPRRQLHATIADETGQLRLRWLHFYPNQQKQVEVGKRVRVRGEVRGGFHGLELIHPKVTQADAALADALTPVYPTTDGLRQSAIRSAIHQAIERADLRDTLPPEIVQRLELHPFAESIRLLHSPPSQTSYQTLIEREHPAWVRIKFDELLAQQLSLAAARAARLAQQAYPLANSDGSVRQGLQSSLRFELTGAQQRVIAEIAHDLRRAFPMHRLLQGDVGSGKTVVAAFAAAQAIDSGLQVAMMAPTELLAEQHYQKMTAWFEPLGVRVGWLSGSKTAKQRLPVLTGLKEGTLPLLVGTQALIQDSVEFKHLGLIILDEQHRFGVGQRLSLSRKGEAASPVGLMVPHQLNMSATPIPRTLAMSFLADLDVSVIDELPEGRTPVITKLVADGRRDEIIAHIYAQVNQGQQVYWVCPLVEESETLQLQTAVDTQLYLNDHLPGITVGLLHGKLSAAEKASVMEAFRQGTISVLVATTVIEVGVDVPNATLMVIEHAERFGLAQLHQLRGRVGRGADQAVCVLLYQGPLSAIARERLRAMYETTDGFEISRRDLGLRGPGEFLGLRQSGQELLRFADIETDEALVEQARNCAMLLREQYPEHAIAHVRRWLKGREDFLRT